MAKVVGKSARHVLFTSCRYCASEIEYTRGEVYQVRHSCDYLGDCEHDPGIRCPGCGKEILVKAY